MSHKFFRTRVSGWVASFVFCLVFCGSPGLARAAESASPPSVNATAARGKHLFNHDQFGGVRTCSSCHINSGTTMGNLPGGMGDKIPSLIGVAAQFPKYNPRAHRVITLGQQLTFCIKGGLKGNPPALDSSQMTALVTYLTKLSKGSVMGQQFK